MLVSTALTESDAAMPRLLRWGGLRLKLLKALRSFFKRFISAILTSVVMLAGAGLIIFSLGIHIPLLERGPQVSAASIVKPVKPKIVASTKTTTTCTALQRQTNVQFSVCPNFLVDYSSQKNGSINTGNFNIYTGKPVANQEAEYYTNNSQNLRVENGSLLLQAQVQPDQGYSYTSARIDTQGKEDFLYGKLVVRAIMPDGIGTWPSIWMLPSQPKYASLSPASDTNRYLNDGEIDIAESIGLQPNVVYGVAHSLAYPEDGPNRSYYSTVTIPGNSTTYHDYELDWTPTSLTFSVDG